MRTAGDHILDRVHEESKGPGWVIAIHLELQRKVALTLFILWEERPWQKGTVAYVVIFDNFVAVIKYEFGVEKRKEKGTQRGGDKNGEVENRDEPVCTSRG
jgi:hypothetical protein